MRKILFSCCFGTDYHFISLLFGQGNRNRNQIYHISLWSHSFCRLWAALVGEGVSLTWWPDWLHQPDVHADRMAKIIDLTGYQARHSNIPQRIHSKCIATNPNRYNNAEMLVAKSQFNPWEELFSSAVLIEIASVLRSLESAIGACGKAEVPLGRRVGSDEFHHCGIPSQLWSAMFDGKGENTQMWCKTDILMHGMMFPMVVWTCLNMIETQCNGWNSGRARKD